MSGYRSLERMPEDWERALAIVAHPDDLEYGAAGAVAEWTAAGRSVAYLLVTRGEAGIDDLAPEECARIREGEQRASAAVVGVGQVEFLDHPDGVVEEGLALRRDLVAAIRRHRPELLITLNHHDTFGGTAWNMPDHRAVGRAVLDAAGDAGNRWVFPEQPVGDGGYGPWQGVRWVAVAGSPRPTHAVPIGARSAELAVASLAEHRRYIAGLGGEHSGDPVAYARAFLGRITERTAAHYGLPRAVTFELFLR